MFLYGKAHAWQCIKKSLLHKLQEGCVIIDSGLLFYNFAEGFLSALGDFHHIHARPEVIAKADGTFVG
jgi:hypothetical protein